MLQRQTPNFPSDAEIDQCRGFYQSWNGREYNGAMGARAIIRDLQRYWNDGYVFTTIVPVQGPSHPLDIRAVPEAWMAQNGGRAIRYLQWVTEQKGANKQ